MVRIILVLCFALGTSFAADDVANGVITASQIDITADDGSLLPDRLNAGDTVFIVTKPSGPKRAGWVRISRSPDDKIGFGWVEQKHIRTFGSYKNAPSSGGAVVAIPTPSAAPALPEVPASTGGLPDELSGLPFIAEDAAKPSSSIPSVASTGSAQKIGIVKFTAQTNDSFVTSVFGYFSETISALDGVKATNITENVKTESEGALQKLIDKNKLDGVFVGSVSDPLDDGRLVQVRFYSGKEKRFLVEKVTRVPMASDQRGMITNFAQSVWDQVKNPF